MAGESLAPALNCRGHTRRKTYLAKRCLDDGGVKQKREAEESGRGISVYEYASKAAEIGPLRIEEQLVWRDGVLDDGEDRYRTGSPDKSLNAPLARSSVENNKRPTMKIPNGTAIRMAAARSSAGDTDMVEAAPGRKP